MSRKLYFLRHKTVFTSFYTLSVKDIYFYFINCVLWYFCYVLLSCNALRRNPYQSSIIWLLNVCECKYSNSSIFSIQKSRLICVISMYYQFTQWCYVFSCLKAIDFFHTLTCYENNMRWCITSLCKISVLTDRLIDSTYIRVAFKVKIRNLLRYNLTFSHLLMTLMILMRQE